MPKILIGSVFMVFFLLLPGSAFAVTVASQTQSFSDQIITHRVLQELGSNLSGIAGSFTFRVSTAKTNLNQFNYTIQNTRIFDKDGNNFSIVGCAPAGSSSDTLAGLTFSITNVPTGYQDVTMDFSCHNYSFIPGHRYLIVFGSASYNSGSGLMLLAAGAYGPGGTSGSVDQFTGGGLRYSNGNIYDIHHGSGSCSGISYIWNHQTLNPVSGCNIWTSAKDDLYFILKNTAPEPTPSPTPTPAPTKDPVIFIPGIGGSELKAAQDIIWSKDDGHNGNFSHAYTANEKIWVNQDEAAKLGDDDYFDILRLKADGKTSEASLSLTGDLTSFGYSDIDSFFSEMGYVKGTNFFVFPYDWRKDVREAKDSLDALVEEAKQKSGKDKVNLVAHSMGGLVARYYISDSGKASKVGKLIELGVPHLGSVDSLKSLLYGVALKSKVFGILPLGIPSSEMKDVGQNLTSIFQLLPSSQYFNFYNDSDKTKPYPFYDDRDIDNNKVVNALNYTQIKNLLSNLNSNMTVFNLSELFHNFFDSSLSQSNNVNIYSIVGSNQPTLGQIRETWWITWPINLIPRTEEIFINGDDTVPLYSATLKNGSLDLSGGANISYVDQTHGELVKSSGIAMQTVKTILNEESLPVEVKSEKISLEGKQISLDDGELELYDDSGNHTGLKSDGEIETNIPLTFYSTSGKTKNVFIKKNAANVKVVATRKNQTSSDPKTTNLKIRNYEEDTISKTILYKDILIANNSKIEFTLNPSTDTTPTLVLFPDSTKTDTNTLDATSEVAGSTAQDSSSPSTKVDLSGSKDSSGVYTSDITITLTGSDSESGILKIEYSLDNGKTVQTYTNPFTISSAGKITIQVKSIDKLGNEEIPQEIVVEISKSSSSSGSSTSDSSSENISSNTQASSTQNTSKVGFDSFEVEAANTEGSVLGINTQNQEKIINHKSSIFTHPILGRILVVSVGVVIISSVGLALTFFKPTPK